MISKCDKLSSTALLYDMLGFKALKEWCKHQLATNMFQATHGLAPPYNQNVYKQIKDLLQYALYSCLVLFTTLYELQRLQHGSELK